MAKTKRKAKLKVYRTPVGFHDAYVAAPSQKAALEAWGSNTNLFSQGAAEQVSDEKLTKVPLEHPGEVVRVLRGTKADHAAEVSKIGRPKARRSSSRKPSRAALAKAEESLAALEAKQAKQRESLDEEEEALKRKRREIQRRHEREQDHARERLEDEQSRYRKALDRYESG